MTPTAARAALLSSMFTLIFFLNYLKEPTIMIFYNPAVQWAA